MIKLNEAVIVEGKYDKIKLSNFIDAVIIETDGFRIFSDKEKKALIKRTALTKGIIILTDSDAAGFRIRNYIKNIASGGKITNVYIPDIYGKEKRKTELSKEGKLGVEGMKEDVIEDAFRKAGITSEITEKSDRREVTITDLFSDGFTGSDNSKERKYKLLSSLGLPKRMSNSQVIKIINMFMSFDDYKRAVGEISDN